MKPTTLLIIMVVTLLLSVFLIFLQKKRTKQTDIPKRKTATQDDFLKWLKPHLKESTFESTYKDKEELTAHVYDLLMNQWRLSYTAFTRGPVLLNNIPVVCSQIVDFLIKEEKITFNQKIPSS